MQSSKRNGTPSGDHLQQSSGSNPGPPGSVQAPEPVDQNGLYVEVLPNITGPVIELPDRLSHSKL